MRLVGYSSSTTKKFWSRIRNRVDLLIVMATIIDEIPIFKNSRYHICLLAFRVVRTYRIAYLFPGVMQLMVSREMKL